LATFTPQRIDPYGWISLMPTSSHEAAVAAIDEADEPRHENGNSAIVGWVVARSTDLVVHSRKDGRFRIIERPGSTLQSETEPVLVAYSSGIESSDVYFATADEPQKNRPGEHLAVAQRDAAARWPQAGDHFLTIVGYLHPIGTSDQPCWAAFGLPDDGPYVYLDTYTSLDHAREALRRYADGIDPAAGPQAGRPTL
jgi:hypothetical protein